MTGHIPDIEFTRFMNWLQNHSPVLYTQYQGMIEPGGTGGAVNINPTVNKQAIIKKWNQLTGDYLVHLQSND